MTKLAPSLLSADFANLQRDIEAVEKTGVDYLHVDVMDGAFVPNLTIGPLVIDAIRKVTNLPLDVHLMIEKPERYLKDFAKAGSNFISVHYETCPHLHRTIQEIKALNCEAGVAFNPSTSVNSISEILPNVNRVVVMSVNPGFGGQKFIEPTYRKIEELAIIRKNQQLNFEIEIDGGVSAENVKKLIGIGADVLIAGSQIFNQNDSIKNNVAKLKNLF